jgi:hypothetical protein
MARQIVRTLEAYSIHGFADPGSDDDSLVDYPELFERLLTTDLRTARFSVGSDAVALTDRVQRGARTAFMFVAGNEDELSLVYDMDTGTTTEVDPGSNRLFVSGVWVIVDPHARVLILERKRPGVPISYIEKFLTSFGRIELNYQRLSVALHPIPSASFVREVDKFTRVRRASIKLRRPNRSWTQDARGLLGQIADSNAAAVEIEVTADRGQSLKKNEGIVEEVKQLALKPIGPLQNATVTGTMPGYENERSVSINKHAVKGTARIDPTESSRSQLEAIDIQAEKIVTSTEIELYKANQLSENIDSIDPPQSIEP